MDANYQDVPRVPCGNCGRKFVRESLAVHERICKKSSQKKRKVFDSTKQRVQGTELNLRQVKAAQKKEVAAPKTNWRAQHQDFVNTVRAARGVDVAIKQGKPLPPPPPPSINPDYIQCPCCQRRFNQKAAERHIPHCKEKNQRLPSKPQLSAAVQARQAARTQYKAPRPKQPEAPTMPTGRGGGIGAGAGYAEGRNPTSLAAGRNPTSSTNRRAPPSYQGRR